MNRYTKSLAFGPIAVVLISSWCVAPAVAANAFTDAMTGGTAHIDARLRYETVEDNVNEDADALTLRTRLGYRTAVWRGWDGLVEFEDVRTVASVDDYAPPRPGYAVIADPEVTELNQGYLQYRSGPFEARYGRQRIIFDNARFVGNVGWRQDEQTFDALRADFGNDMFEVSAAQLMSVEGITPAFDADTDHTLLHGVWTAAPGGRLVLYGYLLEYEGPQSELDTWGGRYEGKFVLEPVDLLLAVEYATQETDDNSGPAFDAEYTLLEAGFGWKGLTFKAGRELLGSDDGAYGFQTPLATKHAFNGWADIFLNTPDDGLEDTYVLIAGKLSGINLKAVYHVFGADDGGADYGTETDLIAARSFGEAYKAGIKLADYSEDGFATDTRKFWIWGEFAF